MENNPRLNRAFDDAMNALEVVMKELERDCCPDLALRIHKAYGMIDGVRDHHLARMESV